jgi:hypothetical protein
MTLMMTAIFAIVAFNVAYNNIQKGDTLAPDDGANMVGFAAAFFVLAPGGCIAAVFFLYGVFHALKLRRQGRNGTGQNGNNIQESKEKKEDDKNMS